MPTPPAADLVELFRQARAGSDEAAKIIFDEYREPLLIAIRRRLDRPDRRLRRTSDSDDFIQEVFFQAFRKEFAASDFSSPQAFLAYLQKVAANKITDVARKQLCSQRSSFGHEVSLEQVQSAGEIEADEPAESFFDEENHARLQKELAKLPAVYRLIMKMWLDGQKPGEIAKVLELDVRTVYRCIESTRRKWDNDLLMPAGVNKT